MVQLYDNDEPGYLAWVTANPAGFVATLDRALSFPQYPMVHKATHGLISSANIGGFTTGDYVKLCAADLPALERYCQEKYGRPLTRCRACMPSAA